MAKLLGYALVEECYKKGKITHFSDKVKYIWTKKPTRQQVIYVVENDMYMTLRYNSKLKNKNLTEYFEAIFKGDGESTIHYLHVMPLYSGNVPHQIINGEDLSTEDFAKE